MKKNDGKTTTKSKICSECGKMFQAFVLDSGREKCDSCLVKELDHILDDMNISERRKKALRFGFINNNQIDE